MMLEWSCRRSNCTFFFIRFDQKTSSYSVRGTGLHLRSDWVTPPVDVKAIFGWKVCSMIIQGKRYLWLQMLTGCHLFLGIGACFKFSHLLLSHVSKPSPFQDTVQQNHCFIYWSLCHHQRFLTDMRIFHSLIIWLSDFDIIELKLPFGDIVFNCLDLSAAFDSMDPNCLWTRMCWRVKVDCGTCFSVFMPPSGQITEKSWDNKASLLNNWT